MLLLFIGVLYMLDLRFQLRKNGEILFYGIEILFGTWGNMECFMCVGLFKNTKCISFSCFVMFS